MDWKNHLEEIKSKKSKQNSKNQSKIAASEQEKHYRESEFLFKHRSLTLL